MDVDARNAEIAVVIATGVTTSSKPHAPPGGPPANKLRRRLLIDGAAETRSLSDPGARAAIALPNVCGASAAASAVAIPQQQQIALLAQGT